MKRCMTRSPASARSALGVCVLAGALALIATAQAQPRHRGPPHQGPGWHGNIERFHEHDWRLWRGGRWQHGWHAGRLGWWWVVGGVWYFYPVPVYPYPNPWEPPAVEPITAPVAPPPTQHWYYCESAKGYYPYVPTCPEGWKQVPATPPK